MAIGALEGIRILDVALQYPGPYCTMLLADLGAEVLKVERPGSGDPARQWPAFFNSFNRNRRSMTLDLKKKEGREIFYHLAEEYDVMTEGFRPGVARKLGIDYETLREINPCLVYCSISGFGQHGPYCDRPGHDLNYMAMSGMLGCLAEAGEKPVLPKVAIADLSAGMFAAIGILAAVRHRERKGTGQYIDCSMFDGLLSWMSVDLGTFWAEGRRFIDHDAGYGIFETRDGKHLALGIAHEDPFWDRLCDALGLKDRKGLKGAERMKSAEKLGREIGNILRSKTRDEWMKILLAADVPASPVQELEDVVMDPHVAAREMICEISSAGNRLRQVAFPMKLSVTPANIQRPPPFLGEHTEEVLAELGYGPERFRELKEDGVV